MRKNTPLLWDSRLEEYKLAALWLEIADKLGSSAGRPIHCAQFSSCLQFGFQYTMTKVQHHNVRLRFLLMRILAAPIIIYYKHTAVTNVTSVSAILEMIDRNSEHHRIQIYRPIFNFSPTRNRSEFLRFYRLVE